MSSPGSPYFGEHGQTLLIDFQRAAHSQNEGNRRTNRYGHSSPSSNGPRPVLSWGQNKYTARGPLIGPNGSLHRPSSESIPSMTNSLSSPLIKSYGSTTSMSTDKLTSSSSVASDKNVRTIRFQVVVWNIGKLDVVAGTVPMTFRVSLFWNDPTEEDELFQDCSEDPGMSMDDNATVTSQHSMHVWKMAGRGRAFQQEMKELTTKAIEVPPLAIMNVSTFQVIGTADVDMLNENTRLMRWTCMYRATVVQNDLRVDAFPHDDHEISLKLGILSSRGPGFTWDRRYWKLDLATFEDTQSTTRIPHGLIVDQARLPGFSYNKEKGLSFEFCRLEHGIFNQHRPGECTDRYLKVSLRVLRESGYYDKNIIPILALENVVAISILTFDDTEFFYRALITLNIAFVQMGIRMTTDNHLPNVEYEIKLQRILNEFFVALMFLVLEAMVVYVLRIYYGFEKGFTKSVDWVTGILAVLHTLYVSVTYYRSKRKAQRLLQHTPRPKLQQIV